jgi:hypothetical protein
MQYSVLLIYGLQLTIIWIRNSRIMIPDYGIITVVDPRAVGLQCSLRYLKTASRTTTGL